MAEFVVRIHCDNAAFDDTPEFEIERILQELLVKIGMNDIDAFFKHQNLLDINGNVVGTAVFKSDD